ncbi:MAG: hypothetical protein IJ333_08875 [Clostridia bacterium]|nr:hypothetical protein [Clostridia bacterium]
MSVKLQDKFILFVFALGTLISKILCFFLWGNSFSSLLSIGYYVLIAATCFFGGRRKYAPRIFSIIFLSEVLVIFAALYFKIYDIAGLLLASHYGVMQIIGSFENVGQTFPDFIYMIGIFCVYVLLVIVSIIGNKVWSKR